METIRLALDWTPNANHIGFFVAQHFGYYKDFGLDVSLLSPETDNYLLTPAKKVELGHADLALAPLESILSYRRKATPFFMKAIATIYQKDISAITCLKDSLIKRPRDLDGKIYASYNARYEDAIVKQMIIEDGGVGDIEVVYPNKLGIWETILSHKSHATWIFPNWEGVHASAKSIKLTNFYLEDYDIPYSYSPVILASENTIQHRANVLAKFLKATKQGFVDAQLMPEQAADILAPMIAESDKDIDLLKAIEISATAFGRPSQWGKIDLAKVDLFLDWLKQKDLEPNRVNSSLLINSDLIF